MKYSQEEKERKKKEAEKMCLRTSEEVKTFSFKIWYFLMKQLQLEIFFFVK